VVDDDSLLIWDRNEKLSSEHGDVVLWQSYSIGDADTDTEVSISQLVEDNADHLRSEYLALIYELGEAKISGKRVVEHLEIRPGFSCWWMTLLVEKCNYSKSPQIDNAIKLMAFRDWLATKDFFNITLVSSNSELADAMQLLAVELSIGFEWKQLVQQKTTDSFVKRIFGRLPNTVQALAWLAHHLISTWPLKGVGVERWGSSHATTTFISYLFNLDPDAAEQGCYKSGYWTELPDMLDQELIQSNWLHIYVKSKLLPTAVAARDMVNRFNRSHKGRHNHVMLDSFMGIYVVWATIRNWYRTVKLKEVLESGLQEKCGYLSPLLNRDFQTSLMGVTAISNLLYFFLFEKAMAVLPVQNKGFYLQENQGWEFGFIHAWRNAGHGKKLMGVPHSTMRYWDLRYYFDPRTYRFSEKCRIPSPDYVCVNGAEAKKMFLYSGYPVSSLIEVEALRYLHLTDDSKPGLDRNDIRFSERTLLVLGEYLEENTIQQMELLRKASQYINNEIEYLVKPHPACPILAEDYPELDLVVTNDPISMLISHCSLVYTSSVTSAAVDAYCAGKRVVTVLDPVKLNLSPLKGCEGVSFVSSPQELADLLNNIGLVKGLEEQGKDYFYLDPNLPKWKNILLYNDKIKK